MKRRIFLGACALMCCFSCPSVTIAEEVDKSKLYVISFGANWCDPCLQMHRDVWPKKSIQEALKSFRHVTEKDGTISPYFVDTDKRKDMTDFYGVNVIPTLLVVDENGKIIKHAVGGMTEADVLKFLESGKKTVDVRTEPVIIGEVWTLTKVLLWLIKAIRSLL